MPIAIATDGGWKRPAVGPGLEAFQAGDPKAPASIAAGGPGDAAPAVSRGEPTRITLDSPAPAPTPAPVAAPVAAPPLQLSRTDLLDLIKSMVALLASLTGLVSKMLDQRGLAAPAR